MMAGSGGMPFGSLSAGGAVGASWGGGAAEGGYSPSSGGYSPSSGGYMQGQAAGYQSQHLGVALNPAGQVRYGSPHHQQTFPSQHSVEMPPTWGGVQNADLGGPQASLSQSTGGWGSSIGFGGGAAAGGGAVRQWGDSSEIRATGTQPLREVVVSKPNPYLTGMMASGTIPDGGAKSFQTSLEAVGEKKEGEEKKEEAEEKKEDTYYHGIIVSESMCQQFLNDFCYFWRHYLRASEQEGLLTNVASPTELDFIHKATGLRHAVLVNMMVWRRSILKLLFIFVFISTWFKVYNAYLGYTVAYADYVQEPMRLTFVEWREKAEADPKALPKAFMQYGPSFKDYSIAIAFEVRRLMTRSSSYFTAVKQIVMALLNVAALVLVWKSTYHWAAIKISRRRVMYAWYLTVGAPFVASMAPARLFVTWDQAAVLIKIYSKSLEGQLQLDQRLQQVQQACGMLREQGDGRVTQVESAATMLCGWVDKLPKGVVTIPFTGSIWNWNEWQKADFDPIHSSCDMTRDTIQQGNIQMVVDQGKRTCDILETTLDQYIAHYGDTPEMVEYFTDRVNILASTSVALMLSMENLLYLLPASIAIAPGLLKGAMRMKLLVPQSTIPGMFVMILPWLYCPMTWAIYSVIFQLVGNTALFVGLMIVAFSPVANAALGNYYHLERPMTDEQIAQAVRMINRIVLVLCIVGYVLVIAYFIHVFRIYAVRQNYWGYFGGDVPDNWGSQYEGQLIMQFIEMTKSWNFIYLLTSNILTLLCSVLGNYFMTGVAGLDWMNERMVEERRIEREVHSREIRQEFDDRMDQMLALDEGKRYSVWVKGEWEAWFERRRQKGDSESYGYAYGDAADLGGDDKDKDKDKASEKACQV